MNSNRRLIMDVGMHRGKDAEFYLRKGFRVVGVEANPRLAAEAGRLLAAYVEQKLLTICPVAISEHD